MKNVEDVYALTPMQEVMLLHAIAHRADDVLFNQFCFEIHGPLNVAAFEGAWQRLCDRHAILRSAFIWEDLKQPVQVVRRKVSIPFTYEDWSDGTKEQGRARLRRYRADDRARGFDPNKAPLLRIMLARCNDRSHVLVWSNHHLLMDRWCLGTVFDELGQLYAACVEGSSSPLRPANQYREYVGWIRRQDPSQAAAYWRMALAGLAAPTPLTRAGTGAPAESLIALSEADTAALRVFAQHCGVTLGILVQGAWALLLNRLLDSQDVVFGVATAGRPADLPGVETIIGSFINNLPVRVRLPRDKSVGDWFGALQRTQHERSPFEYVSPGSIQRASDFPAAALFDTLLVWLSPENVAGPAGLELVPLEGDVTTAYPLTVSVDESSGRLAFRAKLADARRTPVALDDLLSGLCAVLRDMTATVPAAPLGSLPDFRGDRCEADLFAAEPPGAAPRLPDLADANTIGREEIDAEVMEDLLRLEWQTVLSVADVGANDDFFALGGNSLQALSLHARIEAATRQSLPLLALYRATTLRGMAMTLASGDWPMRTGTVMPVRDRGTLPPLFCIASPEVNTVGYVMLARFLNAERPVYVLQAQPDSAAVRRYSPSELPAMAADYIDAMRDVQPAGPFFLLGMCTGAQLTLEMARQLEQRGEHAAFAGVVDTWALYTVSWRYHIASLLNRLGWYAERLRDLIPLRPAEQIAEMRSVLGRQFSVRAPAKTALAASPRSAQPVDNPDMPAAGSSWIHDFGWTARDPHEAKYSGPLTVFRIRPQPFWRVRDPDLGWGRHVERVDVERLPGNDHHAILREPSVRTVGERLESRLQAAAIQEMK